MEVILERLGPQTKVVELSEWIKMLERVDQTDTRELSAKPAIKLLDFFRTFEKEGGEGSTEFSTANARAASKTMAGLQSVGKRWMETWLDQWKY